MKKKWITSDKRSILGTWIIGRLFLQLGIGIELWYFTRSEKKNDYRIYHLLHVGFTSLPSPDKFYNANLLVVSFLLLTMKIGYITESKK